jgi:hypothetical protein
LRHISKTLYKFGSAKVGAFGIRAKVFESFFVDLWENNGVRGKIQGILDIGA